MVGLKICLLLCLGYQVSHNHRVTGVSAWPAHEKHHNEIIKPVKSKNRFEKIGKFQQSSIGSRIAQTKKDENAEQIQNSINNNDKEYETFTHQKATKESSNHSNSLAKNTRNEEEENINELENLLTTISARNENKSIESSETSITQSDAEENVTTEEIPKNAENATTVIQPRIGGPNSLGLTSDSHVKRGVLPQLSNDDGMFVLVVLGVALCCILGVVGVGFLLHRPSYNRSSTPFSDCSPSFLSAKLTFSNSPEEKTTQYPSSKDIKSTSKSSTESKKSSSRSHKFKETPENNNYNYQGQMYNYKGTIRQESLIDIGGPEEDDDDLIYECPGLAPHGEMEVTNPFFLQRDLNMNTENKIEDFKSQVKATSVEQAPCPINSNNSIRHGSIGIVRNIAHHGQH